MDLEQIRRPEHSYINSVQDINARITAKPQQLYRSKEDFKYWSQLAAFFGGTYAKGLRKFECHWEYNPVTGELKTAKIDITYKTVIKKPGMQYYTGMTKESVKVKGL